MERAKAIDSQCPECGAPPGVVCGPGYMGLLPKAVDLPKSYGLHMLEDCGHNVREGEAKAPCCGFKHRPATPSEVLAAAATIDGAKTMTTVEGYKLEVGKPGQYLVIPLPDKET